MNKKKCVKVYMDDDVLSQVKEVADYNCCSVSAVIRSALHFYLYRLLDDFEIPKDFEA